MYMHREAKDGRSTFSVVTGFLIICQAHIPHTGREAKCGLAVHNDVVMVENDANERLRVRVEVAGQFYALMVVLF